MRGELLRVLAVAGLLAGPAAGQAPVIEKVEPPGWWKGSTINPVRLLIRGRNLAGARAECARLRCAGLRVNAAGTYAFLDVTIPGAAVPGRYPFTL
ncbi:MAG TPA: cyclomaltodextrinase N-terminal domain-containing protein, partial [Gemmatimonadales bacterium]